MRIKLTPTTRGFLRGEFIDNPIDGNACSIQQSSALLRDDDGYYLWLGVNDPKPQQFPGDGTGWHAYPLPENVQCTTRMHLSRETAAALIPLLERYVAQGDLQPRRARPPLARTKKKAKGKG